MSGMLNSKQRVLDAFITQAGRAQMATGEFRVKYASFSDAEVFYQADIVSGSTDATSRVSFEACNLPQDNVTFEADGSGLLKPFKNSTQYDVINGQMVSWSWQPVTSSILTGSVQTNYVNGPDFINASDGLLTSSIDNFNRLHVLSTNDSIFEDDAFFTLSTNSVHWNLTSAGPINVSTAMTTIDVNVIDSLFNDPRCAHFKNFQKLPPLNSKRIPYDQHTSNVKTGLNDYTRNVRSGLLQDLKAYKNTFERE